jgi:hypothetical protein
MDRHAGHQADTAVTRRDHLPPGHEPGRSHRRRHRPAPRSPGAPSARPARHRPGDPPHPARRPRRRRTLLLGSCVECRLPSQLARRQRDFKLPAISGRPYQLIGSREHNWLTSKVLLTALRAHSIGSVTLRTGQRALIDRVCAGQRGMVGAGGVEPPSSSVSDPTSRCRPERRRVRDREGSSESRT